MPDNNEEGCKRCKIKSHILKNQFLRSKRLLSEIKKGKRNDYSLDYLEGLKWAYQRSITEIDELVESKMLQLALNELHFKDCTHE